MMFTIEFFRIRKEDNAHATLARVDLPLSFSSTED